MTVNIMSDVFDKLMDAPWLYHLVATRCIIYWPWPLIGTKVATKWSTFYCMKYRPFQVDLVSDYLPN